MIEIKKEEELSEDKLVALDNLVKDAVLADKIVMLGAFSLLSAAPLTDLTGKSGDYSASHFPAVLSI
jgi:hypothetical protein